jgi:hypothetical protein
MTRRIALLGFTMIATAGDEPPELRSWVLSKPANAAILAIAPEVHSVRADGDFVYVESAGLSLHSFGSFEANAYDSPAGARGITFRIPRHPRPATGEHIGAPLGIIGVFATGVPIYNPISRSSYRDQNIWHFDAVAVSKAGKSSLVRSLEAGSSRHSPIIGYALDGYPIYGPYGWGPKDKVRRMRSSYRLRAITHRSALPDGTTLTPAQEGPDVSPDFPLGTFAEDYEFANGSGDLDEYNGRFTRTADYPDGTYAYFLTQWPYMIGPQYYGVPPLDFSEQVPHAGVASPLTFTFRDARGGKLRFLEKIHERPVHLIVVSRDLSEFAHIHPQPAPGDVFQVTHTFAHGGEYAAFADFTAPGEGPALQRTLIEVGGTPAKTQSLIVDTNFTKIAAGVRVILNLPSKLRAGEDLPLSFTLDANNLEPYLGAWAHIMLVSADRQTFIHAHPLEDTPSASPLVHTHARSLAGPSPSTIRTITGFARPGLYKLWFQFQRSGEVQTLAWVLRVAPAFPLNARPIPNDQALRVMVSAAGFAPSRLAIPANHPIRIAFTRSDAQNCANEVVFPEMGIRRRLPSGQTTWIDLPQREAGELHFSCGMGMFKGVLMVRESQV